MPHKRNILTKKEHSAEEAFLANLNIKKRTSKKPLIVALIGLVGSGKTSVAQELAQHIGATIISNDVIRIELRKQKERYENAQVIAENVALRIIELGGNAILDSDFIDQQKRVDFRVRFRTTNVRLVFIRTHCDIDAQISRILEAFCDDHASEFLRPEVKIREMWRRTPLHYRWTNQRGGVWALKKLPVTIFADIDTTHSGAWKKQVGKSAQQLLTT
jgi:predicted kinase